MRMKLVERSVRVSIAPLAALADDGVHLPVAEAPAVRLGLPFVFILYCLSLLSASSPRRLSAALQDGAENWIYCTSILNL